MERPDYKLSTRVQALAAQADAARQIGGEHHMAVTLSTLADELTAMATALLEAQDAAPPSADPDDMEHDFANAVRGPVLVRDPPSAEAGAVAFIESTRYGPGISFAPGALDREWPQRTPLYTHAAPAGDAYEKRDPETPDCPGWVTSIPEAWEAGFVGGKLYASAEARAALSERRGGDK